MNPEDRRLLKGCLKGDATAQASLVRRFSNLIYSTIQGTSRAKGTRLSQQDLEDLHGTVFLQLFDQDCRKLRQYKGRNGCSLASWIRMITVRAVLDHFRRTRDALSRPERMLPLESLADMDTNTSSALEKLEIKERMQLLDRVLRTLSSRDQLMIRMHCIEGCSLKSMAAVLNVSGNNVHSVKHRAIKRMKEELEKRLNR